MAQDTRGMRIAGLTLGGSVVAIVIVVTAMAVTGVVGPAGTLPTAAADELPPFAGCDELAAWYRDAALPLVTPYGLPGSGAISYAAGGLATDAAAASSASGAERAAAPAPVPAPDKAVGNGATGTNVQEAGVDEPDVAKTDGRYVVGLTQDRLYVADTTGTPRVVGTVKLPSRGAELLLDGDRALVLSGGSGVGIEPMPMMRDGLRPRQWTPTTVLTVVDLSDRANPRVTSSEEVDGDYLSARLHDGVVRVVVATSPTRLPFTTPQYTPGGPTNPAPDESPVQAPPYDPEAARAAEQKALQANREVVRSATADDWLPRRTVRDANGAVVSTGPLVACSDVRHPTEQSGLRTVSVLTIDVHRAQPLTSGRPIAVTADGDLVYASTDHLYVATSRWGSWSVPKAGDRPRTQIHEFDVTRPDATTYVASGTVDGFVYGRWAFSEDGGWLRVATTTGRPWAGPGGAGPDTESRVVVLERHGTSLDPVGEVHGLGPGEMVRAVRWFGKVAAVVTFRQTDPLFLVDLSNPTAPTLSGELKMPGYSAYLHPVGDGRLLGVGHDADASGRVQQMQVSLFDVSDPAHPQRTDVTHLGYGWTAVENESRAFTYLPGRSLAVLPVMWYPQEKFGPAPETPVDSGTTSSSGVAVAQPVTYGAGVVAVSVDGRQLRESARWTPGSTDAAYVDVQRVLPVGDRLVAVTGNALVLLDPDGLRPLGTVSLG